MIDRERERFSVCCLQIRITIMKSEHFVPSVLFLVHRVVLSEPKKRNAQNFYTLENRNICKQDTGNRTLSLSIIFSLRNQISNKE